MELRNGTVWVCEAYFAPLFKGAVSQGSFEIENRSRFMCYLDKREQNTSVELRYLDEREKLSLELKAKVFVILIPSTPGILSPFITEGSTLNLSAPYDSKWQVILNADFKESKQVSLQFPG